MPTSEAAKKKFFESIEEGIKACKFPAVLNYQTPLPGSSITVHKVFVLITGIAGIINVLAALYLMVGHLLNWSRPLEQKQQIRVIGFLIALSITSSISTIYYDASVYIAPVGQLYEGFGIVSIFLLYMQIIMPDLHAHETHFRELEAGNIEKASLKWFRIAWACIFQIIVIRFFTLIAFEVLFTTTCPLTPAWGDGKTGITAVQGFSTAVAIFMIVQYEKRMRKRYLKGHRSLRKLWSFKVVLILQIIQEQVFVVLAEEQVWIPPAPYYMSYNDFIHGLPQVIFMVEMLVTAIFFLWAYEWKKYRAEIRNGAPITAGPLSAFLSCCNVMDVVYGTLYAFGGPTWMRHKALGMAPASKEVPDRNRSDAKSSDEE